MGVIGHIMAGRGEISISQLDKMMTEAAYGVPTAAGVTVSESTSLRLIPVFACVRLLANTIASLPFPVYRYTTGGGKAKAWDHPLYSILHDAPNSEMSSFDFWSMAVASLELWGNAYAEISRNAIGDVVGLWPLDPSAMKVDRWGDDGRLVYKYYSTNPPKEFRSRDLLHIRGFGSNGITGYGPIALARQGIGLSSALEEYGARFFGNDSTPGGVLSVEGTLKDEGRKALKAAWHEAHQPLEKKHEIAVLDAGAKFQAITVNAQDAQFIESRKFQRGEIAMLFGIPPHMIGDTERATSWGTGIEHQSIGFVMYTLRPRLEMIEQQVMLSLFTPDEQRAFFAEFVVDGLLRGDASTRWETYQKAIQNGIYSPNDVLRLENMNTMGPAGDQRFINGNMRPIEAPYNGRVGGDGQAARLLPIVREAAAGIIRKEIVAIGKVAKRHDGDPSGYLLAIEDFYSSHAAYVSQRLCVGRQAAEKYAGDQHRRLLEFGPDEVYGWMPAQIDELVALALGGNDES